MTKVNSNNSSYFNLKPKSKVRSKSESKVGSKSRSQSRETEPKKGKTLDVKTTNSKTTTQKRSKSNESSNKATKSKYKSSTKATVNNAGIKKTKSEVKVPTRTGNLPLNLKDKSKEEKKSELDSKFRGKKVLIFKTTRTGALVEEPLPLAVSEKTFPTFDSLLNQLNTKITLPKGRIDKLYKIQGGEVTAVNQLIDKGWYVASNGVYVPESLKKEVQQKLEEQQEDDNVKWQHSDEDEKEKSEKVSKTSRKPPVPKFRTKKEPKEDVEWSRSKSDMSVRKSKANANKLPKHEPPFGRIGTLKQYARTHSLSHISPRRRHKNDDYEEEVEYSKSLSNHSMQRRKSTAADQQERFSAKYSDRNKYSSSGSRYDQTEMNNNYDDTNYNEIVDNGVENEFRSNSRGARQETRRDSREFDEDFGRNSRTREKRSFSSSSRQKYSNSLNEDGYQRLAPDDHTRRKSDVRKLKNDEYEIVHEPSEFEPMNKVMYPTGHRPPSRKDAAISAKGFRSVEKRDAANSAINTKTSRRRHQSHNDELADLDEERRRRILKEMEEEEEMAKQKQKHNSADHNRSRELYEESKDEQFERWKASDSMKQQKKHLNEEIEDYEFGRSNGKANRRYSVSDTEY